VLIKSLCQALSLVATAIKSCFKPHRMHGRNIKNGRAGDRKRGLQPLKTPKPHLKLVATAIKNSNQDLKTIKQTHSNEEEMRLMREKRAMKS
jgi:hypothetical protein